MIALANLSNKRFQKSRLNLNKSARKYGVDKIYSFDFDDDIASTSFYADNEPILSQKRGIGYWLWKPYILLEVLKDLKEGDILIYADCGMEIISRLDSLMSICREKEPILLFGNRNYINAQYTKRDCFVLMDCDSEKYWYSMQCDAAFMVFKKCDTSISFINEWMDYCENLNILTDVPNICGKENLPHFIEHRHDQSVVSILAEKYNINLYRVPSQYNHQLLLPIKISRYSKGILSPANENTLTTATAGENNGYSLSAHTEFPVENLVVRVVGEKESEETKYDYVISYLNSTYGRLVYHHRSINLGIMDRIKFRITSSLVKLAMKLGYRVEKI